MRLGGRGYNLRFPHILGRDFSGVVAKTGEGVTDFAVGELCSLSWMLGSRGRMRKSSPSRLQLLRANPIDSHHLQAAAMALTGITAIWAIEDTVQLQAGDDLHPGWPWSCQFRDPTPTEPNRST